jgi:DNA-binding NtrC family response regulator
MSRLLYPFVSPLTDAGASPPARLDGHGRDRWRGLVDALDQGADGEPRRIVVEARSRADASQCVARITALAETRGFLTLPAAALAAWRETRHDVLRNRTLLLIAASDLSPATAGHALLTASTLSPHGHVLVTIVRPASPPEPVVRRWNDDAVHEARARYAPRSAVSLRRALPDDGEIVGLRERAARAGVLVQHRRHAAAERLLREVASAFERRRRPDEASRVLVSLGRLLLERGRCDRADDAFERAAMVACAAEDAHLCVDAGVWQANARVDAARLTDAESICRAAALLPNLEPSARLHVHATLSRVFLLQGRTREASALDLECPSAATIDIGVAAVVRAVHVRVLLAQDRLFEAGVKARALLDDMAAEPPQTRLPAETAYLRFLGAVGELSQAQECAARIAALASEARCPLRSIRARVLLTHALHRGGRREAAGRELRRLQRVARSVPPLLRRQIQELDAFIHDRGLVSRAPESEPPPVQELIAMALEPDEDDEAVRTVLGRVAAVLRTLRIEVWSQDAGPPSLLLAVGTGGETQLGARALEAGIVLGPERLPHGQEIAVPVRRGKVLVAAIAARWAIDRPPPPDARDRLETAAAIVCGRLESRVLASRASAHAATLVPELVGVSAAMQEVRAAISRAAAAPFSVLIQGESGVGKELVARAIHQLSPRRERPFCDVNCAALPDDLLESELFGHARGAFTGALVERAGLFEAAAGGTLFLDEVADLSPRGQAKLLRVLQQQEVRRVGETFTRPVDVRMVAAANRELREEVAGGRFRSDLLYRLDVIRLRIPPLRERPEDVAPLALHLWRGAAARVDTTAALAHGVLSALSRYHWPGNVRELQNVMAALAVMAPARGYVRPQLLPAAIQGGTHVKAARLAEAREQFERRAIESALARHAGNRSRAARELGLSRQGLLKMMARLGVSGGGTSVETSSDR